MARHIHDSGTRKQTRRYREYKDNYHNKKDQIINIRELLKNNKKVMAKKCIDNYLDDFGEDGYILHELGKYYFTIGDISISKKYYEKVIENNYKNKYYSMYELAKIEKCMANYDKAIKLLDTIINSEHPEKCYARLERAKLYYINGKHDKFLTEITELILTNQPNKLFAFEALVDSALDYNNVGLLKKFYYIMKKDFTEEQKIYYKAIIDKMENHVYKSVKKFEKLALNNGEYQYNSKYHLAIINFEFEEYKKAIDLAEEVSNNYINYAPRCYRLLANTYIFLNDDDKVFYYIEKLRECGGYQDNLINQLNGLLCFKNKEYDKALEYFLKIEVSNKCIYQETLEKITYCYIKLDQYEKALEYCDILSKLDGNSKYKVDCEVASTFLKKQLGMETITTMTTYSMNQIFDYNREAAIEHIKKHEDEDDDKFLHSVFDSDIDVEQLYDYVFEHINEDNYFYNNFMDIYLLEYPNIGTVNDKFVDYLYVVTLPNSKEIITMYPYNKIITQAKKETTKVKKMSRIDKFKQKYGNI